MIHAVERFRTRIERATAKRERVAIGRELAEWFGQLRMIVGTGIEIEDLDVSEDVLAQLEDDVRSLMEEVGGNVVTDAQATVPVDTGFLRDSLYYDVDDVDLILFAGDTARYAYYVEYGSSHQRAQSFLTDAIMKGAEELNAAIDERIVEALDSNVNEQGDEGGDMIDLEIEAEMILEDSSSLGAVAE